jgi:hypothetical protein
MPRLKFLVLRYALKRFAEFLEIADRSAASSGIQPAPDGLGHLTERFERKLVAVAVQPLQIRQGSRIFFARRRSSSAYATRQNPLIQRKYLFQPNMDSLVGYEVILVAERFPSVQSETRERHDMRVVIEADAAQIGNPVNPCHECGNDARLLQSKQA